MAAQVSTWGGLGGRLRGAVPAHGWHRTPHIQAGGRAPAPPEAVPHGRAVRHRCRGQGWEQRDGMGEGARMRPQAVAGGKARLASPAAPPQLEAAAAGSPLAAAAGASVCTCTCAAAAGLPALCATPPFTAALPPWCGLPLLWPWLWAWAWPWCALLCPLSLCCVWLCGLYCGRGGVARRGCGLSGMRLAAIERESSRFKRICTEEPKG